MKNLYSKKSILFFSLLIVVAMFNTVIISANIGNKKSQLFMKDVLSFSEPGNSNLAGPTDQSRTDCSVSGRVYTHKSNGTTVGKSYSLGGSAGVDYGVWKADVSGSWGRTTANQGEDYSSSELNVNSSTSTLFIMCKNQNNIPCTVVNGCLQFLNSFTE